MRRRHGTASGVDVLARFEPFSAVSRRALTPLEPHVDVVHLPAGTVLARAGTTARELAFVLSGEVTTGGVGGGVGSPVGAAALERGGRHRVDVIASTDVTLVVVAGPACRWAAVSVLPEAPAVTAA